MAITFVQYEDIYYTTYNNTIATAAMNTTTGNLLVVCSSAGGVWISSISDTAGNTYVKAILAYYNNVSINRNAEIWYAENITGNANNITTVTLTGSNNKKGLSVAEYSGAPTSNSLKDVTFDILEGGTSFDDLPTSSAAAGDLLVVSVSTSGTLETFTLGNGFSTLKSDLTDVYPFAEYDITAAGDVHGTFSTADTAYVVQVQALFGEAAVGTNMKINIDDTFKDVDSMQINIGDAWKDVAEVKQNIGDAWKVVY